ncbi:MAG: hypothetical protein H0W61_16195 [Bacteroidetes bacterium]|nr:hypothetical protein [Bacteroidota bacterium]
MLLKKIARIVLYVLVTLALLLLIVQIVINQYINKHLADNLKEQVHTTTKGEYTLNIRNASVNLFERSIVLEDIGFIPSPCDNCQRVRYKVEATSISLSEIDVWKYIRKKSVSAGVLNCESLSISIYQADKVLKDTAAAKISLYKILSKNLKELAIKNISVTDIRLKVFKAGNDSLQILLSDDSDIEIQKFLFNKQVDSIGRLFLADKFSMSMRTFSYSLPSGLYAIKGKNMTASYSDSLLTVDSIQLVPKFARKDFNEAAGKQSSRKKLALSAISFNKMDLNLFIEHNWFISKSLVVEKLNLDLYLDKNAEFKPKRKPSIQEAIRSIPFFIKIDSIFLKNANIVYDLLPRGAKQSGRITFNNMSTTLVGLRNDTASYTSESKLKLKIRCLVLNKAKLTGEYVFPLNTIQNVFDCSGKASNISLTEFNSMLENSASISVKSGKLDTMYFSFHSNGQKTKGSMKFLYHDLNVELINRDNKKQGLKKKLLTFVANKFVVINENPRKGEGPRVTQIEYEYYPYKAIFYNTWKSLQSGILPAIGIKNTEEFLKKSDAR